MKNTKREISIISTTFLVTILLLFLICIDYDNLLSPPLKPKRDKAFILDSAEFNYLNREYKKEKKEVHKILHNGNFKTVEAFKFETAYIEDIINTNKALTTGEKPDFVWIYLGKDGETSNKGEKHINLRISIIGSKIINGEERLLNKNKDDVNTRTTGVISAYDKATACPPGCPKSM